MGSMQQFSYSKGTISLQHIVSLAVLAVYIWTLDASGGSSQYLSKRLLWDMNIMNPLLAK